ncbi:ACP phosphodiesterase [Alteromonas ponticola]|uniref:ACP phosphodiesterase n=1 Tax=Alteromonas aquimaris TaxID=2998417 RepID=A0ABT3P6F2_9ALTE|nr:ACP phosphodiesterase [Alteromonas aquimaris]MCW8108351.1 ACP phosphodiesterase [Alteromonas aquimaris]
MNYLAHLYLAQPTADSFYGNLLGDFGGKRQVKRIALPVKRGLENHYLVDKFTDNDPAIRQAKDYFAAKRKRFAGIAIDVLFDHFLIAHWCDFHEQSLSTFKRKGFQLLNARIADMPPRMQRTVISITKNDWFKSYETLDGVGLALDNIADNIRFTNSFSGAVEDIHRHYHELNTVFLDFFPRLINHVEQNALEQPAR